MRGAAERGAGASGFGAAALIAPLLQNLCLSVGDNEEPVYCLASWQGLPEGVRFGNYPSKEDALKVRLNARQRKVRAGVRDRCIRRLHAHAGDVASGNVRISHSCCI